jgi:hydroxyacylglutathione hydrolase
MAAFEIAQFITRSDNFAVLMHDADSGATASIDAPDADRIVEELGRRGWVLSHVFVTHRHMDHVEGVPVLRESYDAEVIGPAEGGEAAGLYTRTVAGGDTFTFAGTEVRVLATPGHTLDHVGFFLPEAGLLFSGDTLFAMGCGRVFEGTPEMMWDSLLRLRALPDDTLVYCGHEYTLSNARFAVTVDPENRALAERLHDVERLRAENRLTLPTTIAREKATNPFLRADDPAVQRAVGLTGADPARVFAEVRARKDRF